MAPVVQFATNGAAAADTVAVTLTATPTTGNRLILVVNSDTTVPAPDGTWTSRVSLVNSQGFYVWEKTAGSSESATVTVNPNGNNPCSLSVIELNAAEVGAFDLAGTDTESAGSLTSKAAATITTTGGNGAFVLAIVALHGIGTATSFGTFTAWTNSFTNLVSSTIATPGGAGPSSAVQHFIGTKTLATDGAVGATSGSWQNAAENAYGVLLAFQGVAAGTPATVALTPARTGPIGVLSVTVSAGGSATVQLRPAATGPINAQPPVIIAGTSVTGGGPAATGPITVPSPAITAAAVVQLRTANTGPVGVLAVDVEAGTSIPASVQLVPAGTGPLGVSAPSLSAGANVPISAAFTGPLAVIHPTLTAAVAIDLGPAATGPITVLAPAIYAGAAVPATVQLVSASTGPAAVLPATIRVYLGRDIAFALSGLRGHPLRTSGPIGHPLHVTGPRS